MRLRQIHVINCSSYLDRIMAIVRPFMRKEVSKLVNIILLFPLENATKNSLAQLKFVREMAKVFEIAF